MAHAKERLTCSTRDCPGDGAYAPPGKGHTPECAAAFRSYLTGNPSPTPARVTLTDDEREALGCSCMQFPGSSERHPRRGCPVPAVETILTNRDAARESALRARVKADLLAEEVAKEISWSVQEQFCAISGSGQTCEIHEVPTEGGRCPLAVAATRAVTSIAARVTGGAQ